MLLNKTEKKKERWNKLANMPESIRKLCVKLAQEMEKEKVKDLFDLLSDYTADDLARLAKSSDGDITEAYNQVLKETDQEDMIWNLRQYLIQNPINVSGKLMGDYETLTYTVTADAMSLHKSMDIDRTYARFSISCEMTFTLGDKSVTVECTPQIMIEKKKPKNPKTLLLHLHECIHDTATRWVQQGCKLSDITNGIGLEWRSIHLEIIHLLWDHPIGERYKQDTKKDKYFGGYFNRFKSHLLPLVKELMGSHSEFSNSIEEENDIAFIFNDGRFALYSEKNGVYHQEDYKSESLLYKKIILANRLAAE